MRLTADQRVKILIIKVMFQSLKGERVQTDLHDRYTMHFLKVHPSDE